ncbi:OXYSTEROL-BINDING PROTEIN-RELATED [Salix viminalis]|uniref:OXYSTEROL-BINDING PROTEIN-RELATED n=1 Tax=Salix viminalis TaxID=40686 RepID=A0A9Q0SCD0_SALVM|nr:OXYSTEROL-BINDING PROTEIN-RELATED [Salix viminalis]
MCFSNSPRRTDSSTKFFQSVEAEKVAVPLAVLSLARCLKDDRGMLEITESRSDDKRFSIFIGKKRLHLRAEIREDRLEWMEALQAVKDMFPRMSNSELMAHMDNVAVSNELRKRLQEEEFEREGRKLSPKDSSQTFDSNGITPETEFMLLETKNHYPSTRIDPLPEFFQAECRGAPGQCSSATQKRR